MQILMRTIAVSQVRNVACPKRDCAPELASLGPDPRQPTRNPPGNVSELITAEELRRMSQFNLGFLGAKPGNRN